MLPPRKVSTSQMTLRPTYPTPFQLQSVKTRYEFQAKNKERQTGRRLDLRS